VGDSGERRPDRHQIWLRHRRACTVHVDGVAMRSCGVSVSESAGRQITTIEGLGNNGVLHKVQQAWIENDVPQCGY
jgi:isoquinoline 1-oxidoreductase subunit alpha